MYNIFLLLLFFILPPSFSLATEPSIGFDHFSIKDGLPHYSVRIILQDSQGYLWIGTEGGLARYDGYSFRVFTHNPEVPSSLSDNFVYAITEDRKGYLWVGTIGGGLNRFNPQTETFQHYRHDDSDPTSLSHDDVFAITEDHQGNLWVGTNNGLNKFNPENQTFQHYRHEANNPDSLSSDGIFVIKKDSQGHLWIGSFESGLSRFNPQTEAFMHYRHDDKDPQSLTSDKVTTINEDRQGNIWVGTVEGLNKFNPESQAFQHYRHDENKVNSLSHNAVRSFAEDRQGNLWVGTPGGLNRFNPQTETFHHFRHDENDRYSLSEDLVWTIAEDHQGNLWMGTLFEGLNRFNPQTEAFQHYRHEANNSNSLSSNKVSSFADDRQGNIWIGTKKGLNRFNPQTETFQHYRHEANNSNSLSSNKINSLADDLQGNIWVGTSKGLNRFNSDKETFQHYLHEANNPNSLSSDYVSVITKDRNGYLWVGTLNGLNRFDPDKDTFQHYRHDANNLNSLSGDYIVDIIEDREGYLWVGTFGAGLNRFNPQTEIFQHYRHDDNDPTSLSHDDVYAITEDHQGNLWVGTNNGLNLLNKQSNKFKLFDMNNGLTNNRVSGVEKDNKGLLWISSPRGLSRFNPETESFKNQDMIAGMQSSNYYSRALFRSHTGELYLGGKNGFDRYFPDKIIDDIKAPIVVFTDLLIANQPVPIGETNTAEDIFSLEKVINLTQTLTLTSQQNMVTFEFTTLHFTNPKKHQYAYFLEGWDQQWISTNYQNRRATYTNLPAGDYVLRIKASNADGVWNEKGASLKITVLPPFWKTWWAYSIYALILILLLWWFVRTQRKKVHFEREINQQLEQKVAERTAELEKISLTDQLTGAHNRRFLDKFIDKEIAQINRAYFEYKEKPSSKLGFIMLDMDHFKQVNDVHGHDAGDKVLVQLVEIITATCRQSDWVVRWGGEEFVVVVNAVNLEEIQNLAERIRVNIETHSFDIGNGKSLNKTCSIGITSYPFIEKKPEAFSWEQTLSFADIALYAVKNNGRNAWISLFERSVINIEQLSIEMAELIDTQIKEGHISYETSLQQKVKWA